MIEISRLTLLILGELLLGLTLLSGVLLGLMMVRKGKVRKAAQHLVERIQSDKASRAERLRKKLADDYRYAGDKLEQGVHDLTQVEMRLYQNVINSYLQQNVVEFQQTDVDVENLVLGYQGLDLPVTEDTPVEVESHADESAEIERLKEENERLSEELRVTMDTMGRMLNEYSSMFAGGAGGELDKSKIKGMFEGDDEISGTDEDLVEEVRESASADSSMSNMTEVDIDELVEPLTQIDDDQSISTGQDMVADATGSGLDESRNQLGTDEIDRVLSDAAENLPASAENSMMDDLAGVDIEIPDVVELDEEPPAEPGSLEDEWAQLLAQDADSPESLETETEADIKQKQNRA